MATVHYIFKNFKTFKATLCISRTLVYKSPPNFLGNNLVQNFPTYTQINTVFTKNQAISLCILFLFCESVSILFTLLPQQAPITTCLHVL